MASLFNEHLAFIHVPKTGGTWATAALRATFEDLQEPTISGDRRGHFTWNELPSGPFRFGFVRDPATWYRSHWTHRKTHGDYPEAPDVLDRSVRDSADFASFVRAFTAESPGYLSWLFETFLGPPGAIEFIGRYESLADDLVHALSEAHGQPPQKFEAVRSLAPVNTGNTTAEITTELRQMIAASERRAVERFGYG
jgi:hypothetical protein